MGYVIYSGNADELEGHKPYGDGECVALPQRLTAVGHTSRWRPGPRVVDLFYLNPGTVVANFKFDRDGIGRFPNEHGYHAALFLEYGPRSMQTGKPMRIWIMDQWRNRMPNLVHKRYVESRGERSRLQGNPYHDSENCDTYYVVMV